MAGADRPAASPRDGVGAVDRADLAERIDAVLPQTQCTRCGYPDCRGYAEAISRGEADINRCPPGGAEGIVRLAAVTGRPARPLDPGCGVEGPLVRVRIEEATCIGCTLCIQACPVDCIVGAPKALHAVLEEDCTGCGLCLPVCPVDCIRTYPVDPMLRGWAAWSTAQAEAARQAYAARAGRRARHAEDRRQELVEKAERKLADLDAHTRPPEPTADPADAAAEQSRRRAVVEAALARARAAARR